VEIFRDELNKFYFPTCNIVNAVRGKGVLLNAILINDKQKIVLHLDICLALKEDGLWPSLPMEIL